MGITSDNLVTAKWLQQHLSHPQLVVLFTQINNPISGQYIRSDKYIPQSIYFDLEQNFCDKKSSLAHTLPSPTQFTTEARKLGINRNSLIVIYDADGLFSAPRVWWMFKSMGHSQVVVLNGGIQAWNKQNYACQNHLNQAKTMGDFSANYQSWYFCDVAYILQNLKQINLLDARSAGRFTGSVAEPRQGLRSGHIPGAINLPYQQCLQQGYFKSVQQLRLVFTPLNLPADRQMVFSCGSGVTACILALAASEIGYTHLTVYDGSWSEWGARADLPIEL